MGEYVLRISDEFFLNAIESKIRTNTMLEGVVVLIALVATILSIIKPAMLYWGLLIDVLAVVSFLLILHDNKIAMKTYEMVKEGKFEPRIAGSVEGFGRLINVSIELVPKED
jgi:hypothetical protein